MMERTVRRIRVGLAKREWCRTVDVRECERLSALLTRPSFSTPVGSHDREVHLRPSPALLGDHDPAPTSRSRHAIARRRLSDRFAATTGRHFICAYSITFDS